MTPLNSAGNGGSRVGESAARTVVGRPTNVPAARHAKNKAAGHRAMDLVGFPGEGISFPITVTRRTELPRKVNWLGRKPLDPGQAFAGAFLHLVDGVLEINAIMDGISAS